MPRQLLQDLTPAHWDTAQQRWLQGLNDLVNRPVTNRGTAAADKTVVNTTGAVQSTGIGIPNALQPLRYAELTVKARVTFHCSSVGPAFLYVYRTTLAAIPAIGAKPAAGDVIVGGGPFVGGATSPGVNEAGSFSFLDDGLSVTGKYLYYLACEGPAGSVLTIPIGSQLLVMERS